jgi:putative transcriptional regulator
VKSPKGRKPLAERLQAGLIEGIRFFRGELTLRTTVLFLPGPPPEVTAAEVAALRAGCAMSQAVFARLLHVSTKTVQNWEQGARKPSRAALRLIQVLRQDPQGVFLAAGVPMPQATEAKRRAPASAPPPKARKQTM